jgi:hypothetical protein
MHKGPKKKTGIARIIWICCLTVFLGSVTTVAIFYASFGDELIADAVRRVVERTVGYRVTLTGIRLVSPLRVTVKEMSLVVDSTVFSSGPATLEFRLGLNPPITVKKVTVHAPSISVDLSTPGGDGNEQLIRRIMRMDIVVDGGELVLTDTTRRYAFVGVNMSYEHGITGARLAIDGSARTEGRGDGALLNGPFDADLRVSGTYPDVSLRGEAAAERVGYRVGEYVFSAGGLETRVRIDPEAVEATEAAVTGRAGTADDIGLTLDAITASGAMKIESGGPFVLTDVTLSVPRFGNVSMDLVVEENGRWKLTSDSDSLRFSAEILRRLGDYAPDFLAGWGISGRARGTVTVGTTDTADGSVAGNLALDLINAGFSSPDGLYLGQGITGAARFKFRDDIKRGMLFDGRLDAHDFGLLLSGIFVNFDKRTASIETSGRLSDYGGVKDLSCTVSIPAVLAVRAWGDVDIGSSDAVASLSYHVAAGDLGGAFDILFRNYFNNRVAWLYTAGVDGSLDCRGTIRGVLSAPRVTGRISINGGVLDFPDIDTRVEGLTASLPFSIDLSGRAKGSSPARFSPGDFGTVGFLGATVRGVEVEGMSVKPALAENAVRFADDVVFSLAGGTVTIGGFKADDIFDENRTIAMSVRAVGIDLGRVFAGEKGLGLTGEFSGDIPELLVAEKKLFTSGGLTAKIFQGQVNVGNIWGQNVFDAGRRLGCDVTFSGIDLGELTRTIEVGRVTGIAEGRIADLVYSYGGPERFVFDVKTVDRRGLKKRVSVEFVDKLTILGSGSTLFSGVLKGGLNRFVHNYDYSKIGIHLELKDDYFTLKGTVHEGGKEYFIKRSGLTGINVINQNPDNRIRFDDMVRRLERINVKDTGDIKVETR